MTLIALVLKDGDAPMAIADLALSTDVDLIANGPKSPRNSLLPFQRIKSESAKGYEEFSTGAIIGFSQKMVCFGPHIVMWSGNYLYAKVVIKTLFQKGKELNDQTFLKIVRDAIGDNVSELGLIYGYQYDDYVRVAQINCKIVESNGACIIVGGTGSWRFTDDFSTVNEPNKHDTGTNFRQVVHRIGHLVRSEMHDPDAYWYGIGGGYEVATILKNDWVRVPYSIVFVVGNETSFAPVKLVNLHYDRHNLLIDIFQLSCSLITLGRGPDAWTYIVDLKIDHSKSADRFVVEDFLRRSPSAHVAAQQNTSLQEPMFNLVSLHKVNVDNLGPAEWWAYQPSVIGAVSRNGGLGIHSRAFFLREVEEHFSGKSFVEPDSEKANYARSRADWRSGIGISGIS